MHSILSRTCRPQMRGRIGAPSVKEMRKEDKSILDLGPKCWKGGCEISRLGETSPLGADCGFPAGLGDVFRPGLWLCVPLQPV